jgi:hypothetical protein
LNIVTADLKEYPVGSLALYLADVWTLMPLALTAASLFLLFAGWFGVTSWRLIAPYLAGAVLSGLTIGKVGSSVNYLIELGAPVSLSLGALLAWQRPRRAVYAAIAALLALDMILMVLASPYRTVTHARLTQAEDARRLPGRIHDTPGHRAGRFLHDLERQAFAAILTYRVPKLPLDRQRWTDEMLAAIERR